MSQDPNNPYPYAGYGPMVPAAIGSHVFAMGDKPQIVRATHPGEIAIGDGSRALHVWPILTGMSMGAGITEKWGAQMVIDYLNTPEFREFCRENHLRFELEEE